MSDALIFLRMFLKYPAMLGSVWPSSDSLCSRLMRLADWEQTRCVVEYGPGVGTITRHILQHLRGDGTLIAIEKNPQLVEHLRERFGSDDARLKIVHGSAADVGSTLAQRGMRAADLYRLRYSFFATSLAGGAAHFEEHARVAPSARRAAGLSVQRRD